jgi:hypothetical protein
LIISREVKAGAREAPTFPLTEKYGGHRLVVCEVQTKQKGVASMQTKRSVPRLLSYGIIGMAVLIIGQIYWFTPWRVDPLAFLLRPVFFLALPLLLAGFAFALQRGHSGRSIVFAAILLLIGLSSMPLLLSLPSIYNEADRRQSYQVLNDLEAWYILVAIPFWFCCFMAFWPLFRRFDLRNYNNPQNIQKR